MGASKTFRVFVSSTFGDMKVERNALQQRVFPKLRRLCSRRGCRFQAIDLRWGVREEAALSQQTMAICLGEVERCRRTTPRPNFIFLLGDRYGWRPLPAAIPADELEEILRRLPADDPEQKQERRRTLLLKWYRRDDNAVPPAYCLRSRTGAFTDPEVWEAVESELRVILQETSEKVPIAPEQRLKYLASATEQEIACAVLRASDIHDQVFGFIRKITNLPPDPRAKELIDLVQGTKPDREARERLNQLVEKLRRRLPGHVYDYEAEWTDGGVSTDHVARLCADVYRSLSRVIEMEIERFEDIDELDGEIADHDAFRRERTRFFVGRQDLLREIGAYLRGGDRRPFAVFGVSGSGKSALMARAVKEALPSAEVVLRFVGATTGSSEGRTLLEGLCRQFSRLYEAQESTLPADYEELVEEFPKRLGLATREKPLAVFIDALDQLSEADGAHLLGWLPAELPEHVRLVVSTLPGESLSALEEKYPAPSLAELAPMSPPEGRDLLDLWLRDTGRTLRDHQREEVLSRFEALGLPLYLKLAFEESRRWKSFTGVESTELAPDIRGAIRDFLTRLSSDVSHGQVIVSHGLSYLAAARDGLAEDELLDVLSSDDEVVQDFIERVRHEPPDRQLPVVVWSRLYFDLEAYLTERSVEGVSLLTFYHRQFQDVVTESFLPPERKASLHATLAAYFREAPLPRRLREWPYHLAAAQDWAGLEGALCDLDLLDRALAAGFKYEWIGYWRRLEGRADPASSYASRLGRLAEKEGESARLAAMMVKVGSLLSSVARPSAALPLYEKALAISERVNGRSHPATADVLSHLGRLCHDMARFSEARSYYERLAEIDRGLPVTGARERASHLSDLATVLASLGELDKALDISRLALERHEWVAGQGDSGIAHHLMTIANVLRSLGEYSEAEALCQRALGILEKSTPGDPIVAVCLNNLAVLHRAQGRHRGVRRLLERALEIDRRIFGENHSKVATRWNNLGNYYSDLGKNAQARAHYEAALEIQQKRDPNHPTQASILTNLGMLHKNEGRHAEAERLLRRALEIDREIYSADHAEVAADLNNLGGLYLAMGDQGRAMSCHQEALHILERVKPDSHDMARVLNNLAQLAAVRGAYTEALAMYQRSLRIKEERLGSGHPSTATTLMNIGALYMRQGKFSDAEPWLKRGLAILEGCLGPDHPRSREARGSLALCQGLELPQEPGDRRSIE